MTTAVLRMVLHCQGCMDKIHKTVMKTKGEVIVPLTPFRYSHGAAINAEN